MVIVYLSEGRWIEGQLIPAIESLNPNLKIRVTYLNTSEMMQAINTRLVGGALQQLHLQMVSMLFKIG